MTRARFRSVLVLLLAVSSLAWVAGVQADEEDASHATAAQGHSEATGHGEAAAGHGAESSGPITWQTDLMLFSVVVFVVLFLVLRQFAWKGLRDAIDAREHAVRDSVERAEQARREAESLLEEHRKKLDLVQDEVRAILEEARRDAASTAQAIVAKAEEDSRALQQRSLREVERARDQALRDIAEQAADLVAAAAGRVVRTSLSGADHRRLIEESLAEFGRGAGH